MRYLILCLLAVSSAFAAIVPVEEVDTLCDPAVASYATAVGVDSVEVCYTGAIVADPSKTVANRVVVIATDNGLTVPQKGMEMLNDGDWHSRIGIQYVALEGAELTGGMFNIEDSFINPNVTPNCADWPTGCNGVASDECVPPGTNPFMESNYIQYKRMLIGAERVTCQIRCVGAQAPIYRSCKLGDIEPPWLNHPNPTNPQPPTGTCPCAGQPVCNCYPGV